MVDSNATSTHLPHSQDGGLFTREIILTVVLALLTLIALYTCVQILSPFFTPLVFAATIVVATQRPYRALERILPTPGIRAGASVLVVSVLILTPISFIIVYAASQGMSALRTAGSDGLTHLRDTLQSHPIFSTVSAYLPKDFNFFDQARGMASGLAEKTSAIVGGSIQIGIQAFITIFLLFFLYRDGAATYERLKRLLPLSEGEAEGLLERVQDSMLATVNGALMVAFVQAILATAVYLALGVPGSVFWGSATFFMALVPVFGTFVIWGPIALYLAITGSIAKAGLLVAFGIGVIGMIDNLLYPYLVGDRMKMHTVTSFFAVLGGIALFGAAGIILGPLIFSVTFELLEVWWSRTRRGKSADGAAKHASQKSIEVSPATLLESQ